MTLLLGKYASKEDADVECFPKGGNYFPFIYVFFDALSIYKLYLFIY